MTPSSCNPPAVGRLPLSFLMIFLTVLLALVVSPSSARAQETLSSITINAESLEAPVNPLLFGQNVLFSGNGMWNTSLNDLTPGVASLVKSIAPTIVRFPGGSFSDRYMWEDGLGYRTAASVTPTDSAIILDTAPPWGSVQKARFIDSVEGPFGDVFDFTHLRGTRLEGVFGLRGTHPVGAEVRPDARGGQPDWAENDYGIDEHMKFAHSIAAQALLTVNYGTGLDTSGKVTSSASLSQRVKRAAAWVAYLNGSPTDTRPLGVDAEGTDWQTVGYWAQKRGQRGHSAPYGVHYWEIGNEVYGNWEAGFTTARRYATDFNVFATALKGIDSSIAVGAVGLADPHGRGAVDSVDEWNATVVRIAGNTLDFLAIHSYYPSANLTQAQGSYTSTTWFTAVMAGAQQAIKDLQEIRVVVTANSARASQIELAVTEYGIWPADSTNAHDYSNLSRALYDADLLLHLVQSGTQLGASLATAWNLHGSNETAAIGYDWPTGARTVRPNYQAFQLVKSSLKRQQVRTTVTSPSFQTSLVANVDLRSAIPLLAALATTDTPSGKLNLLVLNRSLTDSIVTRIHLNGFLPAPTAQVQTLDGPSIGSHNEDAAPAVGTVTSSLPHLSSSFAYTFPPHSLTSMEFSAQSGNPQAAPMP